MFDELVESSAVRKKTNTGWAVILSTIVQVSILVVLILIPLIYTQALPKAMLTTLLIARWIGTLRHIPIVNLFASPE